jgi:FkbM family methyltransferase
VCTHNEYQLPDILQPEDIVLDIGMHIGSFCYAALQRGSHCVYGFEAEPGNYACAVDNLQAFSAYVHLYQKAVWRSDQKMDRLYFTASHDQSNTGGGNVVWADAGQAVEVIAFDDIINHITENGTKRVRLVKIDCEGSEYPILLTARTLHLVDAICGEFHEMGGMYDSHSIPEHARVDMYERFTIKELVDVLQQSGFSVSWTRHEHTNMGHFFAARKDYVYRLSTDATDISVMPCFLTSKLCIQKDFYAPWYSRWAREMKEPIVLHRKQWDFVVIAQSLAERGNLQEGNRGIGFGVGREPLPALFASYGCAIVATDLDKQSAITRGWDEVVAHDLWGLNDRHICDSDLFQQNVSFRTLDMNHIPDDVVDFDFTWSSCAIEHLGSIDNSIDFMLRQMQCLKSGGWAAHTTEFNVSSNQETIDQGPTVLFRRQDIERLIQGLQDARHVVAAVDFYTGSLPQDFVVDTPPYTGNPHLKLALGQFVTTSILILVQKR